MRIHSTRISPRFRAALPQTATRPAQVDEPQKKPLLSIQPGDIFSPSTTSTTAFQREEIIHTEPRNPAPLVRQTPRFTGYPKPRIRKQDRLLAQSVIRQNGSANNALIAMASLQKVKDLGNISATRIMQALINQGADVNYQTRHGISPLLAAVFSNNLQTAYLLLGNGANANQKHHYHRDQSHLNLAGMPPLVTHESRLTYPILETRNQKMLKLLLTHGADINAVGVNENTHQKFSVFDRLGVIGPPILNLFLSVKPKEETTSLTLHNYMARIPTSHAATPWISGNRVDELREIKYLLQAGAIPTEAEQEKLSDLLDLSRRTNQLSERYIPYKQRRLQKSKQELEEIQDILHQMKKQATRHAQQMSDAIIDRCSKRKLSPDEYLQTLEDCTNLKKALQRGADSTYAITHLSIMRANNRRAFQLTPEPSMPKPSDSPIKQKKQMPQNIIPTVFRAPTLKHTNAMSFPDESTFDS